LTNLCFFIILLKHMKNNIKKATIKDVADDAGVSISTVSRVLSDPDFGSIETRDSITKAIKHLNYIRLRRRGMYTPMKLLDNRMLKKSNDMHNIVLFAPEPLVKKIETAPWIYRDVVPALQRYTRTNGLHLILASYSLDDHQPAAFNTKHISGVLWMATDNQNGDLLMKVASEVPTVVLNNDTLWPPQTCVMANNRMILFKGLDHLKKLGHQRIAYFDVAKRPKEKGHSRERLEAYREATELLNLDTNHNLCILEQFGIDEHPQAIARAMDSIAAMSSPPTAVITPLTYAIQFLRETRKRAISVPSDLSIVAIDNAEAAEHVDPALTVVDCVFGKCAEVAIELVLNKNISHNNQAITVLLEPNLIIRESTAPPSPIFKV